MWTFDANACRYDATSRETAARWIVVTAASPTLLHGPSQAANSKTYIFPCIGQSCETTSRSQVLLLTLSTGSFERDMAAATASLTSQQHYGHRSAADAVTANSGLLSYIFFALVLCL